MRCPVVNFHCRGRTISIACRIANKSCIPQRGYTATPLRCRRARTHRQVSIHLAQVIVQLEAVAATTTAASPLPARTTGLTGLAASTTRQSRGSRRQGIRIDLRGDRGLNNRLRNI
jgi:hypothetical protein